MKFADNSYAHLENKLNWNSFDSLATVENEHTDEPDHPILHQFYELRHRPQ